MTKLAAMVCLTVFLTGGPWPLLARVPSTQSQSTELAWEGNPTEQCVSAYKVYEKIDKGLKGYTWKRIGTTHEPRFRVRNLTPGSHTFAVSAVNVFGESPLGRELVVKIPKISAGVKTSKTATE